MDPAAAMRPPAVDGDRADRVSRRGGPPARLVFVEPLHLPGHHEFFGTDGLESLLPGELLGARPCEQHLPGGLDHPAGDADGIADGAHRRHTADAEVLPIHDGRVEHRFAPAVEHRTGSRVQRRIVLERRDRRLHGVERRSAAAKGVQAEPGGGECPGLMRFPLFGRNVPGASVHEEGGSGSPGRLRTGSGVRCWSPDHRKHETTPGTATGIRTPV